MSRPEHCVEQRAHCMLDLQRREHADAPSLIVLVEGNALHVFQGPCVVLSLQRKMQDDGIFGALHQQATYKSVYHCEIVNRHHVLASSFGRGGF